MSAHKVLAAAAQGTLPSAADALLLAHTELCDLLPVARTLRDDHHGALVTYSPKVFIPLTQLCRDVCAYCTFAKRPTRGQRAFLEPEAVLAIARAGAKAGCREALFTLGERPETRWRTAREALAALGHDSTVGYLQQMAALVMRETGLLPHLNPGTLSPEEIAQLRPVAASMGLMLESTAERLCDRGGPHFGSPDKRPRARLATLEAAGKCQVPFTTGILIGIGETHRERIQSLIAIRELHERFGHIQEVIIQNFLPKPETRMAGHPAASMQEHLWSVAVARVVLGGAMSIQAPPNLAPHYAHSLLDAGINDWGGVSPVTLDHVNPEAPWPALEALEAITRSMGKTLVARLPIYPKYLAQPYRWLGPAAAAAALRVSDASGLGRDSHWLPGLAMLPPTARAHPPQAIPRRVATALQRSADGHELSEEEIEALFLARGSAFEAVCRQANELRRTVNGDTVHYVVTRNVNYTNVCKYHCGFCAFSKGRTHAELRGAVYDLDMEEFARRISEAWDRGATEVCLQGGIHPRYDGNTYLTILETAKQAAPHIHVHAFSPLEVWHGASTLGLSLGAFLYRLKAAGLGSLPGTAAEILDDEVRAIICPDKLATATWFEVMAAAHALGLRSTATIMFGHVERPEHWARHLVRLREHQKRFRGFTEFVPLPFVAHEAPIYRQGRARCGPTFREAVLMHAVGRIALHPHFTHVQTSWVKMGFEGVCACLDAGADDLGGTLMNESITRAAGARHGQECSPQRMTELIRSIGRSPSQRTTLYGPVRDERVEASFTASPVREVVNTPPRTRRDGSLQPISLEGPPRPDSRVGLPHS